MFFFSFLRKTFFLPVAAAFAISKFSFTSFEFAVSFSAPAEN